jgi:VWFA-related protein
MRRLRRLACAVAFCLSGMAMHAMGQVSGSAGVRTVRWVSNAETGESESAGSFTFRRRVEEVVVHFVATDSRGTPLTGLAASDVHVYDDREEVRELKSFSRRGHQPLLVGLVVDLSDSIRPEQQLQMLTVTDMLSDVIDNTRDKAFLVGFSNHVQLLQGATADLGLVRKSLQQSRGKHGLTSLFDAVVATCRDEFNGDTPEQRVMLLFSDGVDTLSMHGLDDALEAALRSGVTLYAVTGESTTREGVAVLRTLAEKTGGRAYVIRKKHDFATVVTGLAESMRDEYALTFRPATNRRGFHPVRVELQTNKPVALHTSAGYFLDPN